MSANTVSATELLGDLSTTESAKSITESKENAMQPEPIVENVTDAKPATDVKPQMSADDAKTVIAKSEALRAEYDRKRSSLPVAFGVLYVPGSNEYNAALADATAALGELDLYALLPELAEAERVIALSDPRKAFDLALADFRASDLHATLIDTLDAVYAEWGKRVSALSLPQGHGIKIAITGDATIGERGFNAKLSLPGGSKSGSGGSSGRQASGALIVPGVHVSSKTPSSVRIVVIASLTHWQVAAYSDNDNKLSTVAAVLAAKPEHVTRLFEQDGKASLSGIVNATIRAASGTNTNNSLPSAVFPGQIDTLYVANTGALESDLREAIAQAKQGKTTTYSLPTETETYSQTIREFLPTA